MSIDIRFLNVIIEVNAINRFLFILVLVAIILVEYYLLLLNVIIAILR